MPNFFQLASEYFWLMSLIIGAFNYRSAARKIEQSGPDSGIDKEEARLYLRRFAIAAEIPWGVMGLGKVLGFTPTIWYYFRPQDGNPFVIAWFCIAFAVVCLYAWWILLGDGLRKVRKFNFMEVFGRKAAKPQPEWVIKLFAALGPFFFLLWVYMMMFTNIRLPR